MKTSIRRMGNSHGLIIPKPLLAELGVKPSDQVEVKVKKGRLVVIPLRDDPRARWAAESKALAEAGEAGLVWPEFGNDDDNYVIW